MGVRRGEEMESENVTKGDSRRECPRTELAGVLTEVCQLMGFRDREMKS